MYGIFPSSAIPSAWLSVPVLMCFVGCSFANFFDGPISIMSGLFSASSISASSYACFILVPVVLFVLLLLLFLLCAIHGCFP